MQINVRAPYFVSTGQAQNKGTHALTQLGVSQKMFLPLASILSLGVKVMVKPFVFILLKMSQNKDSFSPYFSTLFGFFGGGWILIMTQKLFPVACQPHLFSHKLSILPPCGRALAGGKQDDSSLIKNSNDCNCNLQLVSLVIIDVCVLVLYFESFV